MHNRIIERKSHVYRLNIIISTIFLFSLISLSLTSCLVLFFFCLFVLFFTIFVVIGAFVAVSHSHGWSHSQVVLKARSEPVYNYKCTQLLSRYNTSSLTATILVGCFKTSFMVSV